MHFNHDNRNGSELAAALANLEASDDWNRESATAVLKRHAVQRAHLSSAQLLELRAWAKKLREVFEAKEALARCDVINELLAAGVSNLALVVHEGWSPHLHFTSDERDVVSRVRAVTSGGLAIFAVESAGERLGVCAYENCKTVFVDTSRNGLRSYCSARCGNNEAVKRYRSRRSA